MKIVMFRITVNETFNVEVIASVFFSMKYRGSEEYTSNCKGQSATFELKVQFKSKLGLLK